MSSENILQSESLHPEEPHILCVGDTFGSEIARMGIPNTVRVDIDLSSFPFFPLSDPYIALDIGKDRVRALATRLPGDIQLAVHKFGLFESIDILRHENTPYIFTYPLFTRGNRSVFPEDLNRIFLESQEAMQLSSRQFPGFCPTVFHIQQGERPSALLEYISGGYEEGNIGISMQKDNPILTFFTEDLHLRAVNTLLMNLPASDKERFMAYMIAKVIAGRTLLTLTTLHRNYAKNSLAALLPNNSTTAAGDFMFRVNRQLQLELRPVTFRAGVMEIENIDTVIQNIESAADSTYLIDEDFRIPDTLIPLVPEFPQRKEWITNIVAWTTLMLHEHMRTRNRLFSKALEQFTRTSSSIDWDRLSETESPFSPQAVSAVATNFGSSWIGY